MAISTGKNMEKMRILIAFGWTVNLNNYLGKQFGSYLLKRKRDVTYDWAIYFQAYIRSLQTGCV